MSEPSNSPLNLEGSRKSRNVLTIGLKRKLVNPTLAIQAHTHVVVLIPSNVDAVCVARFLVAFDL